MSKVISAGKAVMIGSFVSKGISVISSVILARLLFEKDYGALVLSGIFAGLITQIGGMGYELFYLQHKGNEQERRKVLEQVYNLRLLTNFLMFVVQGLIGLYFFVFTENKITGGILVMMAVSLMLEGFNAPQETLLKDKFEFKKITIGNIFKELFATIGKVAAAFLGFGGYSFGVGPVLGSLVRLFYLRKVQTYNHVYFAWDKVKIHEIFNFSKHVLFGAIGMYLVQQIDRILLSVFYPQNIVGRYGFAWGNASMLFNYLIMPQAQLTTTLISKSSINVNLFEKLLILTRIIAIIFIPTTIVISIFIEDIMTLLFTNRWQSVNIIVLILIFYYLFQSLTFPYAFLLNGLGFPKVNVKIIYIKAISILFSLTCINLIFEPDIIIYTLAFVILSILFDITKMIIGIKKMEINLFYAFKQLRYEVLTIIFILSIALLNHYLYKNEIRFPFLIILFSVFIINFLIIDYKKTKIALNTVYPNFNVVA